MGKELRRVGQSVSVIHDGSSGKGFLRRIHNNFAHSRLIMYFCEEPTYLNVLKIDRLWKNKNKK